MEYLSALSKATAREFDRPLSALAGGSVSSGGSSTSSAATAPGVLGRGDEDSPGIALSSTEGSGTSFELNSSLHSIAGDAEGNLPRHLRYLPSLMLARRRRSDCLSWEVWFSREAKGPSFSAKPAGACTNQRRDPSQLNSRREFAVWHLRESVSEVDLPVRVDGARKGGRAGRRSPPLRAGEPKSRVGDEAAVLGRGR